MTADLGAAGTDERAASADGRTFQFPVSPRHSYLPGSFVVLTDDDGDGHLGQIQRHEIRGSGLIATGRILARVEAGRVSDSYETSVFGAAGVAEADAEVLESLNDYATAGLEVGEMTGVSGVRGRLMERRFNRHTFWCGQSGSGKTYALGVLLEELLIHTELPLVIFDPNADFVRLGEVREDVAPERRAALRPERIRVLRPGDQAADLLRARFLSLALPAKAAVLRLDPLIDRAEYNTLRHFEEALQTRDAGEFLARLRSSSDPARQSLALRIDNLALLDWKVWALDARPTTEIIATRPAATVLDLGGFEHKEEPLVIALSVLDELWTRREERRPVLLVIDEAHNLCSPDAETPLARAVLERVIQIAAEGRKFGLWLLLSTQRPSKVHAGIISQCDNLALMRMSSQQDLDELGTIFGFAPPALLAQSPHFRQGEALFAGGFVPAPMVVRMRPRLTHEGGRDVNVPLAEPTR